MSDLITAGRALALDFASTLLFMGVLALGGGLPLAVGLGVALAVAQLSWEYRHGKKIDALQWASLFVVVAGGGAALLTNNPLFVTLKPTILYAIVGGAMLTRGWMMRYMPQDAIDLLPDIIIGAGYVWSGLMFVSAALNLVLALTLNISQWGAVMASFGMASKIALFFAQFALMKFVGKRRWLALHRPQPAAFPAT